jgi:3,4-dihydroxy-2-butanone 4-phosphate synthase
MESVDAAHGITTGISAHDRAATVAAIMEEKTGPHPCRQVSGFTAHDPAPFVVRP